MVAAILSTIGTFFLELLKTWGQLFAAPIENFDMLWIIIPIYLAWIFADFFQEKKGTSLGNAISNAIIAVWAAVDWSRTGVRLYEAGTASGWHLAITILLSIVVLTYGIMIIVLGVKAKSIARKLGRIRIVTYVVLMITPLIYMSDINIGMAVLAMLIFFPVFYFFFELIDRILPDPASIKEEEGGLEKSEFGSSELSPELTQPSDNFRPPKF